MTTQPNKLPFGEDVGHYWNTSRTHPDTWIYRAKELIKDIGGTIGGFAFAENANQAAFMLTFNLGGDHYSINWPVLPTRTNKPEWAKRQAATALYHDVKHKVVTAKFKGVRAAFVEYLVLVDGKTTVGNAAANAQQSEDFTIVVGLLNEKGQAYIPRDSGGRRLDDHYSIE